jgi:DNA polymerase alpha subunit A
MRELKIENWSRIGRFRSSIKWPKIGRQGSNLKFLQGRMLCDLTSDAAKGMIASTTWSLTEMCQTNLKSERQDIDLDDVASYFDGTSGSPERLLHFVRHTELDAHLQAAIVSKVQMLPLTRQLTNIAGNSWYEWFFLLLHERYRCRNDYRNKTLNGGRAERNEYILLHEFHRLKYICPDKQYGKKSSFKADSEDKEEPTKTKRDKYKGGLVFEPKRGLWDKFILVMDFNSLYPSIIQEYNIDFTTVGRADRDEASF